jgi:hypothetical protein
VPDHENGQISPVAVGSSYIRANFSGAGRDHRSAVREGEARKGGRILYRWRAGCGRSAADAFEKRFPGIAVTAKGDFSNVLDSEIDQQLKDNKVTADFLQLQTGRISPGGIEQARYCTSSPTVSTRFSRQ